MLTIPMSQLSASTASVLVLGRSEKVLRETVDLLRDDGRAAGATNDFDHVLAQFDIASLDLVVFGGMVPPDTKEALRASLAAANHAIAFVQGLAGIPGLIAAQVEAALLPGRRHAQSVEYHGESRTVTVALEAPATVRVIGFWHTAFVPPDPESTSKSLFAGALDAGTHTIVLPASVPTAASFIVVRSGADVHPFVVGPMPRGSTLVASAAATT